MCERSDGSRTWSELVSLPIAHDFVHFAVETYLKFDGGFFGLIKKGWEIDQFGSVDSSLGVKRPIPAEAIALECMVGVFDIMIRSGVFHDSVTLNKMVGLSCEQCKVAPTADLSDLDVREVLNRFTALLTRWNTLAVGESLSLTFPEFGHD